MDKQEAIAILRKQRDSLQDIGVESIALFGSFARDQNEMVSDIDLLVSLSDQFSNGGFDHFHKLEQLKDRLSALLGRDVDLVEEPIRPPRLNASIAKDRIVAFS